MGRPLRPDSAVPDHRTGRLRDGPTDGDLLRVARLPHLREVDISTWKGQITDRGLAVLRHLPELPRFQMCWQQNVMTRASVTSAAATSSKPCGACIAARRAMPPPNTSAVSPN
ncbi:hypothetical protein SBA3_4090001 [Candidatus Sulfopaludibacter sp. SbA3]|nr:hypothetical protein SBA3_4090001 [Candidatus Sulfopaludibacter sp. SbA3]